MAQTVEYWRISEYAREDGYPKTTQFPLFKTEAAARAYAQAYIGGKLPDDSPAWRVAHVRFVIHDTVEEATVRERALAKLSKEEIAALGIKDD